MNNDINLNDNNYVYLSARSGSDANSEFARVTKDGEVTINWELVDEAVANPDRAGAIVIAIARLMVAIRDGTYKSLQS